MSASEEVYGKVAKVLVEALSVDEEDVTPTATLQGNLGAESIDFLDIVFRLEREFGIRIPRGELFPESVFEGDPDLVREGRVTDQGLAELRSRMPYADLGAFAEDRRWPPSRSSSPWTWWCATSVGSLARALAPIRASESACPFRSGGTFGAQPSKGPHTSDIRSKRRCGK